MYTDDYSMLHFTHNNLKKGVVTKVNFSVLCPGDYIHVVGGQGNHYGCYVGVLRGSYDKAEGEFLAYTRPSNPTFLESINSVTVDRLSGERDLFLVPLPWLIKRVFIFDMSSDRYSIVHG